MTSTLRKIVVGYDGSDLADSALRWAVHTAALHHDRVVVVVAAAPPAADAATWALVDDSYWEAMQEVADAAEKLVAQLGHADVEVRTVRSSPVSALIEAAQDAHLLVLGATGHGRVASMLLGSVSRHLATYAPCSVVVVRPAKGEDTRVVVGVERGPSSVPAVRFALEHADDTGATVTAIHAFHARGPVGGEIALPTHLDVDTETADRLLAEALAGAMEDYPYVGVVREPIPLRAEEVLVEASKDASLVVVGSRGRNPFARLLLGSVSQHVLQHAHCPVAIVR